MSGYHPDIIASIALTPSRRRPGENVCDDRPADLLKPAQRGAVMRKREANADRDLLQFIRATAHLPDEVFGHLMPRDDRPREFSSLLLGLGRRRKWGIAQLWVDEPERRTLRTAHQVIAERRL